PGGHRESSYLARTIKEAEVTVLQVVPTLLQLLLEEEEMKGCRSLRRLLSGGEALSAAAVRRGWQELGIGIENLYGPTEVTIDSTYWRGQEGQEEEVIPIGRVVSNLRVYVARGEQEVVAVGVKGELYIGGAGVARGYLKRAKQTAEKFVPDGLSGGRGARLYKSGDLVRYREDGNLEYLGRLDEQVKLRGYRIEPGEIEAALVSHAQVRQAAVVARREEHGAAAGELRLIAYVVGRGAEVEASELRRHLQGRLPEYMLPATYVWLAQLPLTANGKLDRRALPAPDFSHRPAHEQVTAPRTPVEEVIAGIFAEVLGRQQVGREENFFELGGHSLRAVQVMARLRESVGVGLELRALFEAATVAGLSRLGTARLREEGAGEATAAIKRVERGEGQRLSYAQERLWFLDQLEPGSAAYNIQQGALVKGRLQVAALEQSLNEIVRRQEVLRTRFTSAAGEPRQEVVAGLLMAVRRVDLRGLGEEEG